VLRLLLEIARGGKRLVVVFDGPPDESLAAEYGPLRVRFAGSRSADSVILALLPAQPGGWLVVSDDRALRTAARERGARVLHIEELLRRAGEREPRTAAEREAAEAVDVTEWEEWFRRGGGEGGER
jgi:hypothetical protein